MDVSWWQHGSAALLMLLMFRDFRISSLLHRKPKESSMQISIPSISCGNCARHVTKALEPVSGVESVTVDVAGKIATVSGSAQAQALLSALDVAGYPGTVVGG
jgi:copper chaperone CopZ